MSHNNIKLPPNISLDELLFSIQMQCLLNEITNFLKQGNLINSFKEQLRNSKNINEEIFNLESLIKKISHIKLDKNSKHLLLIQLKAFLNKSDVRVNIPNNKKLTILTQQNYTCNFCPTKLNIEISHFDHIVPFKYVGDELENNIQALCPTCNLEKGTNPFYFLKKILIQPK